MKDVYKLNGKIIITLSRSLQKIHSKSEILFRQNNLTMAQFAVLEALYHKGDMTIGSLIEVVLSSSGNMTVVVKNLQRDGLIERLCNPKDKRSFLISLTKKGNDLIAGIYDEHMSFVEENLAPLEDSEKETIIDILRKLY